MSVERRLLGVAHAAFLLGALLAGARPARAQIWQNLRHLEVLPFELDVSEGDGSPAAEESSPPVDPAGDQVLHTVDGNSLHGALESLDSGRHELHWRRQDASQPLPFSTRNIDRLTLARSKAAPRGEATVKLLGASWISGDLLSIHGGKLQLRINESVVLSIDRSQVEWIYLAKGGAIDCYDGPSGLLGWKTNGSWSSRNGALVCSSPGPISRVFASLPEKVDYQVDVDQGWAADSFKLVLHASTAHPAPGDDAVSVMLIGGNLQMTGPAAGAIRVQHVDLSKIHPSPSAAFVPGLDDAVTAPSRRPAVRPFRLRVLENRGSGRLLVYVDGRKAAEWTLDPTRDLPPGVFSFQPLGWRSNSDGSSEQSLSRIKVQPWDGVDPGENGREEAPADQDLLSVAKTPRRLGRLEDYDGQRFRFRTHEGLFEAPRADALFLQLARPLEFPDEDPPVARLRLVRGGEFEASSLEFRGGKFGLKTSFSGALSLDAAAVRDVAFTGPRDRAPVGGAELLFRNGDRLHGALQRAGRGERLQWQPAGPGSAVEFAQSGLAGVLLEEPETSAPPTVEDLPRASVRLRNGDLWDAAALHLDDEQLHLQNPLAGALNVPRNAVKAIYYTAAGKPVAIDGASGAATCDGGPFVFDPRSYGSVNRDAGLGPRKGVARPWNYFGGVFSLPAGSGVSGHLALAPDFDSMPQLVEVRFDISSPKWPVTFSARLFSSRDNGGYAMQVLPQSVIVFDAQPRQRAGRAARPQALFAGKIKESARVRHVRLFADRPNGRVIVMIDGVVLEDFSPQKPDGERLLGPSVVLLPQPGFPCAISNIWVGPWTGQPPALLADASGAASADALLLTNGDEAEGRVDGITEDLVKIEGDAGVLEVPSKRVVMVEFKDPPAPPALSSRFRFAGLGIVAAQSFFVGDRFVDLQSDSAGPLRLPLASLRELVFAPRPAEAPSAPAKP